MQILIGDNYCHNWKKRRENRNSVATPYNLIIHKKRLFIKNYSGILQVKRDSEP